MKKKMISEEEGALLVRKFIKKLLLQQIKNGLINGVSTVIPILIPFFLGLSMLAANFLFQGIFPSGLIRYVQITGGILSGASLARWAYKSILPSLLCCFIMMIAVIMTFFGINADTLTMWLLPITLACVVLRSMAIFFIGER